MSTPAKVAALLKGLRSVLRDSAAAQGQRAQHPPLTAVELLLWIAAGVDHETELARVMGVDQSTVCRLVSQLAGRQRWRDGKAIPSPFGLVTRRKHPHRRGYQLGLSANGSALVDSTFGLSQKGCSGELQPCAQS